MDSYFERIHTIDTAKDNQRYFWHKTLDGEVIATVNPIDDETELSEDVGGFVAANLNSYEAAIANVFIGERGQLV